MQGLLRRVQAEVEGRGLEEKVPFKVMSSSLWRVVQTGRGGASCMPIEIEEGKEKRMKLDEEAKTVNVILATQLGSVEVARQPRRVQ